MRKVLLSIIIVVLFLSCEKKSQIEIYLLKDRKPNKYGVDVNLLEDYLKNQNIDIKDLPDSISLDTINKKIFFSTDFNFSTNDLSNEPLIVDDEIICLNLNENKIIFNNSGGRKILNLKTHLSRGEQFVITVDKKPVFNGYFYSMKSSNGSTWNTIEYDDFKTLKDTTLQKYSFSIFIGDGTININKRTSIDFKKYPILIDALTKSDRLVKD